MSRSKKPVLMLAGALALLACSFGSLAFALTIPQTTEQLVGNSSDVIRGKVVSQKSQWDNSHSIIYTAVSIEVKEVVSGSLAKSSIVSVIVPGGQVGDTGMKVEHGPEFEVSEDVVLFLSTNDGVYGVTSWEMGKFTVQNGTVREKKLPVAEFINEIKSFKK